MADSTIQHIDGLDGVVDSLLQLPIDIQQKILVNSGRKAAEIFAEDARNRAPVEDEKLAAAHGGKYEHTSGALCASIHVAKKSKLPQGVVLGYSVVAGNAAAYYASWIEWGFHHVGTEAFIQIPYMRPAFDSEKEAAIATVVEDIKSGIDSMQNGRIQG